MRNPLVHHENACYLLAKLVSEYLEALLSLRSWRKVKTKFPTGMTGRVRMWRASTRSFCTDFDVPGDLSHERALLNFHKRNKILQVIEVRYY